jgi:hypothetical protein
MLLVDSIKLYSETAARGLPGRSWCHLVSTVGEDELHAFAVRLGMRQGWAQLRPQASQAHYDLIPKRRAVAVKLGAVEVASRQLVLLNYDGSARRGLRGLDAQVAGDAAARKFEIETQSSALLDWSNVYSLVAKSETDAAIDMLLGRFNTMLTKSDFDLCDSALRSLDLSRLDVTSLVAILSITQPASEHLKARPELVRDVERILRERESERADRLIRGLR